MGGQFISEVVTVMANWFGTTQLFTIGYRPQANGLVERANGEIMRHLKAIVLDSNLKNQWSLGLPLVQRVLNATVHSSTGVAPVVLLFGSMITPSRGIMVPYGSSKEETIPGYVARLYEAQEAILRSSQLHLADELDSRVATGKDVDSKCFSIGDYVLVTADERGGVGKLSPKCSGPLLVVGSKGNIYSLENLCTKKIHQYDVSRLKKFVVREGVDPLVIAAQDRDEAIVKEILDHNIEHKGKRKTYSFLVEFEDGDQQWLPYMECRDLAALDAYLLKNPNAKRDLKL